jgi:hypothetical protein
MKRLLLISLLFLGACDQLTKPSNLLTIEFTADSYSITTGGSTTLRWNVTPKTADVRIDPNVGNGLPVQGNRLVSPTVSTTYTLNARVGNTTAQQYVTVSVK